MAMTAHGIRLATVRRRGADPLDAFAVAHLQHPESAQFGGVRVAVPVRDVQMGCFSPTKPHP